MGSPSSPSLTISCTEPFFNYQNPDTQHTLPSSVDSYNGHGHYHHTNYTVSSFGCSIFHVILFCKSLIQKGVGEELIGRPSFLRSTFFLLIPATKLILWINISVYWSQETGNKISPLRFSSIFIGFRVIVSFKLLVINKIILYVTSFLIRSAIWYFLFPNPKNLLKPPPPPKWYINYFLH